MAREVWWLRGPGGGVWAHQLPLPDPIQQQLDRQQIQRVMPPPSTRIPWTEERQAELDAELAGDAGRSDLDGPTDGGPADLRRPARSDSKTRWVDYAVAQGMARATAESMPKSELIATDWAPEPY